MIPGNILVTSPTPRSLLSLAIAAIPETSFENLPWISPVFYMQKTLLKTKKIIFLDYPAQKRHLPQYIPDIIYFLGSLISLWEA
jgi:hypothetical protein